jgi:hypothetical protein
MKVPEPLQPKPPTLGNSPMWRSECYQYGGVLPSSWVPQFDRKAYDFDCTNFCKTLGSLGIRQHICGICFAQVRQLRKKSREISFLPQVARVHIPDCA